MKRREFSRLIGLGAAALGVPGTLLVHEKVPVDRFLTDISVKFIEGNSPFIADKVFPAYTIFVDMREHAL